jgi:hypothetical protein
MTARILGRRGLERLLDELTGRDRAIVRQVAELRLMSARQIERIHFSAVDHASAASAARCARRVLERLVRERLLVRLQRRIGGVRAGSAGYIYALGPVGQRVIGEGGPRRRPREPVAHSVVHTLAISEIVVALTEASRLGQLEILQLQTEPTCWRYRLNSYGSKEVLKPDLFVSVGVGDFEHRWFVEVDLGNQSTPSLLRKCDAYERYYRAGSEQAEHKVFPRVIWLLPDNERAERLAKAIADNGRLTHALFQVAMAEGALDVMSEVRS